MSTEIQPGLPCSFKKLEESVVDFIHDYIVEIRNLPDTEYEQEQLNTEKLVSLYMEKHPDVDRNQVTQAVKCWQKGLRFNH